MAYRTYTCPTARRCGGCEWLAVPYAIQLRRKQSSVCELLGSAAEKDGGTVDEIHGMDTPLAFRHKCASPFAPGHGRHIRCGFYVAGTHRIVACERCIVENPLGRAVINSVVHYAERLRIAAYHEDSGTGCLRHAVVRCGYATDEALLTLVTNGWSLPRRRELASLLMHEHPQLVGVVQNMNARRDNAILGSECRTLRGSNVMHDKMLGCVFELGATSFYQTNPKQTEVLYRAVLAGIGLEATSASVDGAVRKTSHGEGDASGAGKLAVRGGVLPAHARDVKESFGTAQKALRVLDAYCGCGTIGICAAIAGEGKSKEVRVVGVERVAGAVASARRNAASNGIGGRCTYICADATAYMRHATDVHFDVAVMDPPRAGSTPEFLSALCGIAPERIVYVSCNVATQARDLEFLRAGGYRILTVAPVDMFPHTKHVETVVTLERK